MNEQTESQEQPVAAHSATPQPGAWRAPVFWMACGALLACLAGGAVLVAQRIGVERDLAAVATLLPPPPAAAGAPAAPPGQEAAAGSPAHTVPADVLAGPSTAASAAAPPPPPALKTAKVKRGVEGRKAGRQTAQRAPQVARAGKTARVSKPRAGQRRAAAEKSLYWEVFKRCPLPGEPGAVECRRHVCNGAERQGPACKPYRGKWR
ncbi:hypothetical protein [Pseudoduganella sp.]|uniref:hypothetical protein n=1 Tax=Pseudoduganella sp. TaxID=1880898 RepID=UPI0035B40126